MKSNSQKVLLLCLFAIVVISIPVVYFVTKSKSTPELVAPPAPLVDQDDNDDEPIAPKAAPSSGNKKTSSEIAAERLRAFKDKQGATGDKIKMEAISRFLDASGVAQEFLSIDDMIEMQIAQIRSLEMPDEDKADFEDMLRKTFNGQEMLDAYIQSLNEKMTPEQLAELDRVYKDPLIVKDNETNAFVRTEEGQKDFGEYMKAQASSKEEANPEREAAIKDLDAKTHMSENAFSMINNMMGLMQDSMISVEKEKGRMTPQQESEMKAASERGMGPMRQQIESGTRMNLGYGNRNVSLDDMRRKAELYNNPSKQMEIAIRQAVGSDAFHNPEKAREIKNMFRKLMSKMDHGGAGGQQAGPRAN